MLVTHRGIRFFLLLICLSMTFGCAVRTGEYSSRTVKKAGAKIPVARTGKALAKLGYAIQAGAFTQVENAARLTETLQAGGLNATYFVAEKGLYKVQFGNFKNREEARERAELLQAVGVIDAHYIVSPGEYAVAVREKYGDVYLREELIKTAKKFMGIPYLWGGTSADTGFDCSGLAMAVYQLNGLDLPRVSADQFEAGLPVEPQQLEKGDLVFFSTSENGRISHVGIYAGNGQFIHAPRRGRNIRMDRLSHDYYRKHYRGGRSYVTAS